MLEQKPEVRSMVIRPTRRSLIGKGRIWNIFPLDCFGCSASFNRNGMPMAWSIQFSFWRLEFGAKQVDHLHMVCLVESGWEMKPWTLIHLLTNATHITHITDVTRSSFMDPKAVSILFFCLRIVYRTSCMMESAPLYPYSGWCLDLSYKRDRYEKEKKRKIQAWLH